MIRLHPEQLNGKLQFMRDYISAQKRGGRLENGRQCQRYPENIATMEAEIMKDFFVQINRAQVSRKIAEIFDQSIADEYIRQIEAHEIYVHDETSLKPYCVSVTLYPFLLDGLSNSAANLRRRSIWHRFAARLSILCLPSARSLPAQWRRWNF